MIRSLYGFEEILSTYFILFFLDPPKKIYYFFQYNVSPHFIFERVFYAIIPSSLLCSMHAFMAMPFSRLRFKMRFVLMTLSKLYASSSCVSTPSTYQFINNRAWAPSLTSKKPSFNHYQSYLNDFKMHSSLL